MRPHSRGGDEEERCKDLILLCCFRKNGHRLMSGSPIIGSIVFCVWYCFPLSVMQKEKNSEGWSLKRAVKVSTRYRM